MKQIILLWVIAFSGLVISCNGSKKKNIARLVEAWQGKTVLFPENMIFTSYRDTVDYRIPEADYKVVVYVDSLGCTSCKLQLSKWKELIRETDSITDGKVPFLFFFHPKKIEDVFYMLKRERFARPVCVDPADRFNELNRLPSKMNFQTFLLDRENRIVVIGNPVHNAVVRDLYRKEIAKMRGAEGQLADETASPRAIRTTAEAEKTVYDVGGFPKEEGKEVEVTIKNTGRDPLVVLDVSTTCGCITATFGKAPAPPGGRIGVKVKISPEKEGPFEDVITLKCNTPEVLQIKINGKAE